MTAGEAATAIWLLQTVRTRCWMVRGSDYFLQRPSIEKCEGIASRGRVGDCNGSERKDLVMSVADATHCFPASFDIEACLFLLDCS